jgi:hypothetical protein
MKKKNDFAIVKTCKLDMKTSIHRRVESANPVPFKALSHQCNITEIYLKFNYFSIIYKKKSTKKDNAKYK